MTNYPYYIAAKYDAGILHKYKFGLTNGKKFNTWSDCADGIRRLYKKFPQLKEEQILILEYSSQYESNIIEICQGDEWISVAAPLKLM